MSLCEECRKKLEEGSQAKIEWSVNGVRAFFCSVPCLNKYLAKNKL
jgi:YHS domain-containing protein